jgi:hypothetical protein
MCFDDVNRDGKKVGYPYCEATKFKAITISQALLLSISRPTGLIVALCNSYCQQERLEIVILISKLLTFLIWEHAIETYRIIKQSLQFTALACLDRGGFLRRRIVLALPQCCFDS